MNRLHISAALSLSVEAVTQKFAFLGRTGSGKTYAATKMAEEMLKAKAQIVAMDPVGVWYGLRINADGKTPGFSIPVFGGLHGDIPLEPGVGAYLADLIIDQGISAVLDVSQFEHDTEKARFAADFANRFFFRKKASPSAVHLFVEECQEFVPQNPQKGEERMLHAFQRIEKLGRNFGIGVSLISQRPQEINKKALNQTECMFAFQMTGPQERKAVKDWVGEKGLEQNVADVLPGLKVGTAHIWSPQWLCISETFAIAKKQTFNASSTPEVGQSSVSRHLAPIEIDRIKQDMAATIERAKAEDPKELKKKIAELQRQLTAKPAAQVDPAAIERAAEEAKAYAWKIHRTVVDGICKSTDRVRSLITDALEELIKIDAVRQTAFGDQPAALPKTRTITYPDQSKTRLIYRPVAQPKPIAEGDIKIGAGARRMLACMCQWFGKGLTPGFIRAQASMKKSGTYDTYISQLRTAGFMEERGGLFYATQAGLDFIGEDLGSTPTTTAEVLALWSSKLGKGARVMLDVLIAAPEQWLSKDELAARSGFAKSGTFDTYLSQLRTAELIVVDRQQGIAANKETLFL